MPHLLLVKHSLPEIDPAIPAVEWRLSGEGRRRCTALAKLIDPYRPSRIYSSPEPKALETAGLLAAGLHLAVHSVSALHEHARRTAAYTTQAEFQAQAQNFFDQPTRLVWGEETARQACRRFTRAVRALLAACPNETLLVVCHGTVISLFTAQTQRLAPFPLWSRLGLPALLVFDLPGLRLLNTIEEIA